jgi:hypothetical protein
MSKSYTASPPRRLHSVCVCVCVCVYTTVRISRESLCGGMSALVRFGGKVYCWVDYRAANGGKQYDAPGSYTVTYRLKTSIS